MPKGHRSVRSQGYYRLSPVTTPTTLPSQYAPISARQIPNTYYNTQGPLTNTPHNQSMSQQQSYNQSGPPSYSNGGPVQLPLSNQQYTHAHAQIPQPMSIRASSGAWTPQDDQTLMAARAQGMNWAPIQQSYFQTKTPNACRKRHERLMERRSADDWDGLKLENLAKTYMDMRREIWSALAAQTGEKWNVVEQKCMSQGLKNLQTAARSHARRERMLDPNSTSSSIPNNNNNHHHSLSQTHSHQGSSSYTEYGAHTDVDSGYADDLDRELEAEAEAEYDADDASDRSTANYDHLSGPYQNHNHNHSHNHNHNHSLSSSTGSSSGNGSLRSLAGMGGMGMLGGVGVNGMGQYSMHQSQGLGRLPSMDMGIDAIINRAPGGQ
ncbi:hypothetical protein VTL71DRAFT_7447 [Oculimacula yallundae]|uniref:Myb-like domain-containing protein n=1 Tax=Oculimacula yallundae TaxID=86028 RepID=A0ABR4BVT6_9HELO